MHHVHTAALSPPHRGRAIATMDGIFAVMLLLSSQARAELSEAWIVIGDWGSGDAFQVSIISLFAVILSHACMHTCMT